MQQLGHHRGHPAEMTRARCPVKLVSSPPTSTKVVAPLGYISSADGANTIPRRRLRGCGNPPPSWDKGRSPPSVQIGWGSRKMETATHQGCLGRAHQGEMALVQGAHGRDKP